MVYVASDMPKTTDVPPSISLKYYDAGDEIAIQFRSSADGLLQQL
jgi:hypothetical protein